MQPQLQPRYRHTGKHSGAATPIAALVATLTTRTSPTTRPPLDRDIEITRMLRLTPVYSLLSRLLWLVTEAVAHPTCYEPDNNINNSPPIDPLHQDKSASLLHSLPLFLLARGGGRWLAEEGAK